MEADDRLIDPEMPGADGDDAIDATATGDAADAGDATVAAPDASETDAPPAAEPGDVVPPRDGPRQPSSDEDLELIHQHALFAAATASGMKAEEIRILDVHGLVTYTDFLVICTGRSVRQTTRIAEEIGFKQKTELGRMPRHVEGQASGEWVLLDFLDFIVHVFTPEAREFYRLDVLWKEAPVEVIE